MSKVRAALPLSLAIALLAFAWVEISMNFTFHWVTAADLGNGLGLPANIQLIAPAAFVSWAMFFAAGADAAAFSKSLVGSVIGAAGAGVVMFLGPKVSDLPDFWGIAVVLGVVVFGAVLFTAAGDWYFVPAVFGAFAVTVLWWIATGLDGWALNGGGVGNSLKALGDPATAGAGAFGGVLSVPAEFVVLSAAVSLACGAVLGFLSVKVAGALSFLAPAHATAPDARNA